MDLIIEEMKEADWPRVQAIYDEGIATHNATFETEVPDWDTWNKKHRLDCRLVARVGDEVVAWAALSPVSTRQVYAGVAEVSIYVAANMRGRHIGRRLLPALIAASEAAGIWTLQASIFPENRASLALHKAFGFREVGYRQRIAQLHGVWRNTILIERRSPVVGT